MGATEVIDLLKKTTALSAGESKPSLQSRIGLIDMDELLEWLEGQRSVRTESILHEAR